jgi:hypothetical protein
MEEGERGWCRAPRKAVGSHELLRKTLDCGIFKIIHYAHASALKSAAPHRAHDQSDGTIGVPRQYYPTDDGVEY